MKRSTFEMIAVAAMLVIFPAVTGFAGFHGSHDGGHDGDSEVDFTGTIESLPSTTGFIGDWKVSGRTVHVTSATRLEAEHGVIAVGSRVKVEGQARSDASVDAKEIKVVSSGGDDDGDGENELEFKGTVQSLPATAGLVGDWKVSGRTVHVTAATHIEQEHGAIAVGVTVKVEGTQRTDGSIDAKEIDAEQAESEIKFTGIIESLPSTAGFIGDWKVGGRTVHVTSATRIEAEDGPVAVGVMVEVEGAQRADGSIDATQIEIKANVAELQGTIERLPGTAGFIGDWKVSGRTVHVGATTRINQEHGAPAVGALVEVKGSLRADGSIDATSIEVKSGAGGTSEGDSTSFRGAIQSLPASGSLMGDWTISSRLVHVVSSTKLKSQHGAFAVGATVKVKGIMMADGSTVATKIQVKE